MKYLSRYLLVLCLLFFKLAFAEKQAESQQQIRENHFRNIDELVQLHAPQLALKYLQREQTEYQQNDPGNWLLWEQKHIALLQHMQQWQQLDKRIEQNTGYLQNYKVATADRNWFLTQQLRAMTSLKQYQRALNRARDLLWNANTLVRSETIAAWRRIIIQIYLNLGKSHDAQIAMRRYQQDYGELQNEDGVSWLQVQAELLIQLQRYQQAMVKLRQINTEEAQALTLLAQLKSEKMSALDVLDQTQLLLATVQRKPKLQNLFQYVSLVAADQAEEVEHKIRVLAFLLSRENNQLSDSLIKMGGIKVDADTLWSVYIDRANQIANKKGMLKGDDASWYALGSNLFQDETVNATSLFAFLSVNAREAHHQQLSMQQLVKLVESNDQSLQLVNALFTTSSYFSDIKNVAAEVRYRLIDFNLMKGKIQLAASLMDDLKEPPKDQPQIDWNLRRARVMILSGKFESGAEVLDDIIRQPELESLQADKLLQVVFDLQAVGQHRLSLRLFDQLQQHTQDARLHRELLFWKAESYAGLDDYQQAAFLFLKSANLSEKGYDPWYHTATFRAAESLLDGGLYSDARQRFLHLFRITENSARKAVIRQRLQTIQLKQHGVKAKI